MAALHRADRGSTLRKDEEAVATINSMRKTTMDMTMEDTRKQDKAMIRVTSRRRREDEEARRHEVAIHHRDKDSTRTIRLEEQALLADTAEAEAAIQECKAEEADQWTPTRAEV